MELCAVGGLVPGAGYIGVVEIFQEMKAEHPAQADGHVGVGNFVLWGAWFLALLAGERYLWGGGLRRAPGAVGWLYQP